MWRVLICLLVLRSPAMGYPVGPAIPLDTLAAKVDLVVKAKVVSVKPVTDASFEPITAYPVYEARLDVISTFKGKAGKSIRFRYYTYKPANVGIGYSPLAYTLEPGRTYVVFAMASKDGSFRQFQRDHTQADHQGVIPAGDDKPHRGTKIGEVAWEELRLLARHAKPELAIEAIQDLDQLSGGNRSNLKDLDRNLVLDEIRGLVLAKDDKIATAAITVFGTDGPYFVERDAPFWLAGIGKGAVVGLVPRKPTASPSAARAVKELIEIANTRPALKALAIRALGPTKVAPAQLIAWSKDSDVEVRRAAILISAESADRALIKAAVADPAPELRATAALAIGFSQDAKLLPLLDKLAKDGAGPVRASAAMSLLAFSLDEAGPILKANLNTDFGPLFVNALAKQDAKPYLTNLAEIVEKNLQPANWWGGSIPAGVSWRLLFDHFKALPAAELAKHTAILDSMERMKWFGSSEPTALYALYVHAGLTTRATNFRALIKKSVSWNNDLYFDQADKNPAGYLQ